MLERKVVENDIYVLSKAFALRIVKLYKFLTEQKHEFIISKQLLRSGTSIGANVHEAKNAQSRPDFSSKMNISLKEAGEAEYWIELLMATEYLNKKEANSILNDCIEIKKILHSIVKKIKSS